MTCTAPGGCPNHGACNAADKCSWGVEQNKNVEHYLESIARTLMRMEERQATIEILLEKIVRAAEEP